MNVWKILNKYLPKGLKTSSTFTFNKGIILLFKVVLQTSPPPSKSVENQTPNNALFYVTKKK